jgi:hypothetical protein
VHERAKRHLRTATERVLDRAAEWHSNCQRENWSSDALDFAEGENMLWTIFVILLVMWLLGLVTSYTLGGFIHILLIIAIAVALIQIISGRRVA